MDYDPLALSNQLCFPIYLCSKEIIRRYTPLLKELDLTYTQYIVMMYFWEKKQSNVRDISKALLLDPSTLTPLLKKLEQKGYLKRSRNQEDERNLDVVITETGEALREKALRIPEQMGKCLDLSEEETVALHTLIGKALANVEKELAGQDR